MGYISAADSMGLSSFFIRIFVLVSEKQMCNVKKRVMAAQGQFKVIQGR